MDGLRERTSTTLHIEGGVLHLLRFARAQCHAALAFAALPRDGGGIDIVAVPPLSDGSEWTLDSLQGIARQTLEDPMATEGRSVIRVSDVFRRYWPGEQQETRMAVAPLKELDADTPCGLLCVLDPALGQFSDSELDMLGRLALRLVNHLRARRRLMRDLLESKSGPGAVIAPPPPPPPPPPSDAVVVSRAGSLLGRRDDDDLSFFDGDGPFGRAAKKPTPAPASSDGLGAGPGTQGGLGLSELVGELDAAIGRLASRGRPGALLVVEVREPGSSMPAGRDELEAAASRLSRQSRRDDVIVLVGEAMLAAILALRPGSRDLPQLRERLGHAIASGTRRPQLSVSSAIVRIDPDDDRSPEDLLFSAVRELSPDRHDPDEPSPSVGGPDSGGGPPGGGCGGTQARPAAGAGPGGVPGRVGDPSGAPPVIADIPVAPAEATEVPWREEGPSGAPPVIAETPVALAEATGVPGLGHLVARGAAYLTVREAVGAVLRLLGTVIVMRLIGPGGYGLFAGAAAFVLFVSLSAQMGAEIFLIRQPEDPSPQVYAGVLTFLVVSSILLSVLGLAATFLLPGSIHPAGVLLPLRVLLLSVPINVCWAPFQAKIERDFGYRKIGFLELAGDAVLYATAVPLALAGLGPWSLVAGYFAWQVFLLAGAVVLSRLPVRLVWSPATTRALLRHGLSYASTSWVVALANLANPLVIGRYAGARGVGFVSFAQRLVATVGFAARSAYRLGIVAISKIKAAERSRLRRAVELGSLLQLVALALPLGAFALLARLLVPVVFGHRWDAAIALYSLLALAAVLNASGLIQVSVLLSRGRNLRVTAAAAVQSVVFIAVLAATVRELGILAYGIASVAGLVGLALVDVMARREVGFGYRHLAALAVGLVPPVLAPLLPLPYGLVTLLPLAGVLALRAPRRELAEAARLGRSLVLNTAQ